MKRFLVALAIMFGAVAPGMAQGFTAAETVELKKIYNAGNDIRKGLVNNETVIGVRTTAETRSLLASIEHALTEVDEGVVNAFLFLGGSAAERDDAVRDFIRTQPRSAYLQRAYFWLDESVTEGNEALGLLDQALLLRLDDTLWQDQLGKARFQLVSTLSKVNSFNRTLAYATPPPIAVLFLDQVWQAAGQYGYDITIDLEAGFNVGPILTSAQYKKWAGVLSQEWLFTGQVMNTAARICGITVTNGENIKAASLLDFLDAKQHLHVIQVSLAGIYGLLSPSLFQAAMIDLSDAWRHLDELAYLWANT